MDEVTVHKNMFERRISARYVRFNPRSWRTLGQICMRVEIYLCQVYQGKFLKMNLFDPSIIDDNTTNRSYKNLTLNISS